MNVFNWVRPVAALALLGVTSACDADLTEINENPNSPEEVPVASVLSSGIWDLISNAGGRGVFGEWTTLYHTSLWVQHTAQAQYNDEDNYTPREGINENIWQEMYAGSLTDLQRAQELAIAEGNTNLEAVTDILMVYGFLFLTDLFGDIPYTEALNLEEFPAPKFTPQEQIYPDLLARLEAAAGKLTPGGNSTWAAGDLIYGGNTEQWQEFANSLRLRIAMRVSDTPFAAQARQDFQEAWGANRFDGNEDNADLDWTGTLPSQNPIYEQIVLGGRTGDFRVSETLVTILSSRNDPRLPIFAEPAAADGVIRGLPNGLEPVELGKGIADYSTIGNTFIEADAPSVMMSYAETLFLGAEAAARGWLTGVSAQTLYEQAITASMSQYGISQAAITAYLAQPSVATASLENILLQKWIALWMNGPEAFAEVRRTGVPDLPLPGNAVIEALPARMPYPPNEGLYNPNFKDYEDTDILDPLWWM